MKQMFLLLLFLSSFLTSHAETDTLRHYPPTKRPVYFYTDTYYLEYIARFIPKSPGYLKALRFQLDGGANGSFTMHLYGHEGGTPFPQLEKDLITPITVRKTKKGAEQVTVTLPDSIFLDNNQFFIGMEKFDSAKIGSSNRKLAPTCTSQDGGEYDFQFIKTSDATYTWQLPAVSSAYIIDAVINYNYSALPASYLEDITIQAGIDTTLSDRSNAWGDYNGDGWLDLLISGRLYKNNGNGTFSDMTAKAGLSGWPQANAFIDMNNDGKQDILFLGGASILYLNLGNDSFKHITQDSLPEFKGISSFSIADINKDGYPDLFVGQLWQVYPDALPNYFFINDRNNGFINKSGIFYPAGYVPRRSRGSCWVDYDNDGDMDLYVTNYYLEQDEFYRNNGDGTFTDICAAKSIDVNKTGSNHGTGVDWTDYDNDGDMDLLLTQFAHPNFMIQYDHRGTTIYNNSGAPDYNFIDTRDNNGIEYEETHSGGSFGDVNNDGLPDILITTYYGCRYIDLYEQQPDHTFKMMSYEYGLKDIVTGEDASWVDYDNDGKLDLAGGKNYKFRLFHNRHENGNNSVSINLICTSGNKLAIGAKVTAWYDGKPHMQEITAGRGQVMQRPPRLHFGMGNSYTLDSVVVWWPSTSQPHKESFKNINVNTSMLTLTEGGDIKIGIETDARISPLSIVVYPNPVNDIIRCSYEVPGPGTVSFSLFDMQGRLLHTEKYTGQMAGTHYYKYDKKLSEGIYFLQMQYGQETVRRKVIIE